jgi:hypothetical protein
VLFASCIQLSGQRSQKRLRQEGSAVSLALAPSHAQPPRVEIHVFGAQGYALHDPQPGAIEQGSHQVPDAGKLRQHGPDLLPRHHHRQPNGSLGANDIRK